MQQLVIFDNFLIALNIIYYYFIISLLRRIYINKQNFYFVVICKKANLTRYILKLIEQIKFNYIK